LTFVVACSGCAATAVPSSAKIARGGPSNEHDEGASIPPRCAPPDAPSAPPPAPSHPSGGVTALAFSPDGRFLARMTAGELDILDLFARRLHIAIGLGWQRASLAFSGDGAQIAIADGAIVSIFDLPEPRLVARFRAARDEVHALAFAPRDASLVTASHDSF